ncbi:MAG: tRNA dihydrouridine synthase DusB [Clostridia bacterium]|nr:tRNA dihydrouridine synthase DusB [Clostridia bacterium]MDD4048886.1 tRNA dihydrouridine synthase DusB [Clostridia bacterium]
MQIGNINISNKVVLAPMAGITDKAFRIIAREHGCGLVYTEMVSAKALTYNNERTKLILDIQGEEQPVAVQLFGCEPEIMAEGAKIAEREGARIIDINMGCPVPKVVKNGEGSALLENPELAAKIISTMVQAVAVPVTVKIRTGWDKDNIVAVSFAKKMEEAGASAIAVHGRTRDQHYAGEADWTVIEQVKRAVSLPVIGNGDIWSAQDAKKMLEQTGCDAVMLGRGVRGNPWLIKQVYHYLEFGEEVPYPQPDEKIKGAIKHLNLTIKLKGEESGIKEMRKHLIWYLKGLAHTAALKENIFKATTQSEVIEILNNYLLQLIS